MLTERRVKRQSFSRFRTIRHSRSAPFLDPSFPPSLSLVSLVSNWSFDFNARVYRGSLGRTSARNMA